MGKLNFTQKTLEEIGISPGPESMLECEFTDIVIIGGDGLFSQYLNSIYKHHYFENLVKIPVCILPGGSTNSLSCDLGGREPLNAAINLIRAIQVPGDIFRVDFDTKDMSVLGTAFTWGFFGDIVGKAEKWRECFGSNRYIMCGAKELF